MFDIIEEKGSLFVVINEQKHKVLDANVAQKLHCALKQDADGTYYDMIQGLENQPFVMIDYKHDKGTLQVCLNKSDKWVDITDKVSKFDKLLRKHIPKD